MNPYLAKLRARDETHHPHEPSKPSKRLVTAVTHADTTTERGFEGFEGERSRRFSYNEAAVTEQWPFGCFGHTWVALARRSPEHVPADRWQQAVDDGRRFLAQWRAQVDALGWPARDLFGLSPAPDNPHPSYLRLSRYDETGLIWLLRGRPVVALTANTAAIENPTGTITIYRKNNKPAAVVLGLEPPDFGEQA